MVLVTRGLIVRLDEAEMIVLRRFYDTTVIAKERKAQRSNDG